MEEGEREKVKSNADLFKLQLKIPYYMLFSAKKFPAHEAYSKCFKCGSTLRQKIGMLVQCKLCGHIWREIAA